MTNVIHKTQAHNFIINDEQHAALWLNTYGLCASQHDFELLHLRGNTLASLKTIQNPLKMGLGRELLASYLPTKDYSIEKVRTQYVECKRFMHLFYENELLQAYIAGEKQAVAPVSKLKDVTV